MDINDVFKVIEKLKSYPYDEIDIEVEGLKLHLNKHAETTEVKPTEAVNNATKVVSPMVGIFHLATDITVGSQVTAGDVVAQVESMKLLNDIKAPVAGIITSILVEDGAGIEFEQPLITINEE